MNRKKIVIFSFYLYIMVSTFISCKRKEIIILSNKAMIDIQHIAQQKNISYCVVIVEPSSRATEKYKEWLKNHPNLNGSIFNFVDINLPQNNWYKQCLLPMVYPLTCVFAPSGELLDIINGSTFESFSFLTQVIKEKKACLENDVANNFNLNKKDVIYAINKIIKCKISLDKGENIQEQILKTLNFIEYPYNLGLKLQNELLYHLDTKKTAAQLLTYKNTNNILIYSDLFLVAQQIITPNYNQNTAPSIYLNSDTFYINSCVLGQVYKFELNIKNPGKFPLTIFDIASGCGCLKFVGEKKNILPAGHKLCLPFELKPDVSGEIERNVYIISDAIDPLKQVNIKAFVKEK